MTDKSWTTDAAESSPNLEIDETVVAVQGYLADASDIIRKMWQHEDTIANHRLTWFNTTQGLLFAALALVLRDKIIILKPVLAFVGLGSCVLTFISLQMGATAKSRLQKWWEDNGGQYNGPPTVGFYVTPGSWLGYLAPSNLLPVLFACAWIYVAAFT